MQAERPCGSSRALACSKGLGSVSVSDLCQQATAEVKVLFTWMGKQGLPKDISKRYILGKKKLKDKELA